MTWPLSPRAPRSGSSIRADHKRGLLCPRLMQIRLVLDRTVNCDTVIKNSNFYLSLYRLFCLLNWIFKLSHVKGIGHFVIFIQIKGELPVRLLKKIVFCNICSKDGFITMSKGKEFPRGEPNTFRSHSFKLILTW